jgi:hypothetical protein
MAQLVECLPSKCKNKKQKTKKKEEDREQKLLMRIPMLLLHGMAERLYPGRLH